MFENIKFFFKKITSSKFVRIGKCNKCGNCCRNIVFYIDKKIITDEEEFIRVQKFDKRYYNFEINGRGENGEILFKCKALSDDGKCINYKFRSLYCRLYPFGNRNFIYKGGETIQNCGYKFVIDKKFSDYIKEFKN